jgi:hypothetical protein
MQLEEKERAGIDRERERERERESCGSWTEQERAYLSVFGQCQEGEKRGTEN